MTNQTKEQVQMQLKELIQRQKELELAESQLMSGVIYEMLDNCNDSGNAKAFIKHNSKEIKFVSELKQWVTLNDGRWCVDRLKTEMNERYDATIKIMKQEFKNAKIEVSKAFPDDASLKGSIKTIESWFRNCGNIRTQNSTIEKASRDREVAETVLNFDNKGHFFGVKNGVVDLRDGTLTQNDPSFLMLRSSPIEYDVNAKCPRFEQFLLEILEDEDTVETMNQIIGSCLVGRSKDKFFVFQGSGSNGKTTLVQAISYVLGSADDGGYCNVTDPRVFLNGQINNPEYYLARLHNTRMLYMSEIKAGSALDESIIKQLTPDGGEKLTARIPCGEVFEFSPICTPIMLVNPDPIIKETGNAIWRRLVKIAFNRQFSEHDKDRTLESTLKSEAAGILNWCVKGAIKYLNNNCQIQLSERVVSDTEQWRHGEDTIGLFWNSKFRSNPGTCVSLRDVMIAYGQHREIHGGGDYGSKSIKKQLESIGVRFFEKANIQYAADVCMNGLRSVSNVEMFRSPLVE